MRQQKRMSLPELGTPSMQRVLETMRCLDNELACWDEQAQDTKPITGEADAPQGQPPLQ
jgi:hypothetical protein